MKPQLQNEVTGPQRLAHELAWSLTHVEGVQRVDDPGDYPQPGLAYEELALRWIVSCMVPGQRTDYADDRSLPWSADVTRPPAGAMAGVSPLDSFAREMSQLMYQQVIKLSIHPLSTTPWTPLMHDENLAVIVYTMGGYTFTATVGPGESEDKAEVWVRLMVVQPEFE